MIVKEHAELEKAKKSVDILQRGLLNLARKYARIFRKGKLSFKEQIMSKDKYVEYTFKN